MEDFEQYPYNADADDMIEIILEVLQDAAKQEGDHPPKLVLTFTAYPDGQNGFETLSLITSSQYGSLSQTDRMRPMLASRLSPSRASPLKRRERCDGVHGRESVVENDQYPRSVHLPRPIEVARDQCLALLTTIRRFAASRGKKDRLDA